jgi:hypothetical protein
MSSSEDYQAKADEALKAIEAATSEAERARLRRSHGVYMKLASHGAKPPNAPPPSRPSASSRKSPPRPSPPARASASAERVPRPPPRR